MYTLQWFIYVSIDLYVEYLIFLPNISLKKRPAVVCFSDLLDDLGDDAKSVRTNDDSKK